MTWHGAPQGRLRLPRTPPEPKTLNIQPWPNAVTHPIALPHFERRLFSCFVVLVFWCFVVLLFCCFVVSLFCCFVALLFCCFVVLLFCCFIVSLFCFFVGFGGLGKAVGCVVERFGALCAFVGNWRSRYKRSVLVMPPCLHLPLAMKRICRYKGQQSVPHTLPFKK